MEATKSTTSTSFLTLSPSQSSPPSSPIQTKTAPAATSVQVPAPTEPTEPLKKSRRVSSGSTASDSFLRLGPVEAED